MGEGESNLKHSKDVFSTFQENTDSLFNGIKRSVPRYHQSITNVQQEYLQACEDMMNSAIGLQREYVKKVGVAANMPEATLNVIRDLAEAFAKASSIQNQMILATIDATQKNIRTFSDSSKSFADLGQNVS